MREKKVGDRQIKCGGLYYKKLKMTNFFKLIKNKDFLPVMLFSVRSK